MQNYEQLILSLAEGDTPKQKYDFLFAQLLKLNKARGFIKVLKQSEDTDTIGSLREFINSTFDGTK